VTDIAKKLKNATQDVEAKIKTEHAEGSLVQKHSTKLR